MVYTGATDLRYGWLAVVQKAVCRSDERLVPGFLPVKIHMPLSQ